MRLLSPLSVLLLASVAAAFGQTAAKPEFEVASIKTNPPQQGFHFGSDAVVSGGPGTADPGMFRCSKCPLAVLITKAFNLQPYQFPGKGSLNDTTYEVMAKIPAGATPAQFSLMLQNLLQERFNLAWHFQEKQMKGYQLVVAKGGSKLKESTETASATPAGQHGAWQSESHSHGGAVVFGTMGSFRAANQSIADLVKVLSDQIGLPVDDATGLKGKYDIALRWAANGAPHNGANHSDGGFGGAGGHGGHDAGGAAPGGVAAGDPSGPTIFEAVQQQLGLRLASAEQTAAKLFIVDKVSQKPSEN